MVPTDLGILRLSPKLAEYGADGGDICTIKSSLITPIQAQKDGGRILTTGGASPIPVGSSTDSDPPTPGAQQGPLGAYQLGHSLQ